MLLLWLFVGIFGIIVGSLSLLPSNNFLELSNHGFSYKYGLKQKAASWRNCQNIKVLKNNAIMIEMTRETSSDDNIKSKNRKNLSKLIIPNECGYSSAKLAKVMTGFKRRYG